MKNRKINVYINGCYAYTTEKFQTLKAAKNSFYALGYAIINNGYFETIYKYNNKDNIVFKFDK